MLVTVRSYLLTTLVSLTVVAGGCERPQPRETLAAYVATHNRHDVEAAVAFFSDDAVFELDDHFRFKGRDAIRDLEAWDATLRSSLSFGEIVQNGRFLTVNRIVERNRWFELAGIEEVTYRPGTRITIEGGRITAVQAAQLSAESTHAITEAMSEFVPWATSHHPEKIERILPDGRFVYNAQAATIWLELLQRWKTGTDGSAKTDSGAD